MKRAPALTPSIIRALARDLAERLALADPALWRAQPGRLVCPKQVHELGINQSPDGLSADYLALAASLNSNRRPAGASDDLLAALLRVVEAEITRARLAEGALLRAMDGLQ